MSRRCLTTVRFAWLHMLRDKSGPCDGIMSSESDSDEDIEKIRLLVQQKLGLDDATAEGDVKEKTVKVLDDVSLDGIANYIKDKRALNIITMAGAGISTSAGIPDFRSPSVGLYHNLQKYELPEPEAIFDIDFFKAKPQPFFALAKELFPGSFRPTKSHYFIRLLHEKGLLLRHYTQNIDALERVAGVPDDKLIEAHGTFHTSHCLGCKKKYSLEWMKEQIFADNVPTCTECNEVVKPDIVFFKENLPEKFFKNLKSDFRKCDLLIILGSSLVVQPFASLVDTVEPSVPRLLINRDKAGKRDRLMKLLGVPGGLDYDSEENTRDVAWLGDCDEGCQLLADKLGWEDDLKALMESEHRKFVVPVQSQKEENPECGEGSEPESATTSKM
ncbi:NAD-dependent protein deacetylase sirtuin-2-like isoform X2 [Bacillus rossius redtenbacheri]|uniref:NAD-dependent protein deacetylase sirtuin-2-like isoform X2 n=1 Tax=Bacillus rossius redtenbacheri TaxID=93214 RepID=UPI002FDCB931